MKPASVFCSCSYWKGTWRYGDCVTASNQRSSA